MGLKLLLIFLLLLNSSVQAILNGDIISKESKDPIESLMNDIIRCGLYDNIIYLGGSESIDIKLLRDGNLSFPITILEYDLIPNEIKMVEEKIESIESCTPPDTTSIIFSKTLDRLMTMHINDNKVPLYVALIDATMADGLRVFAEKIRRYHPRSKIIAIALNPLVIEWTQYLFVKIYDFMLFNPIPKDVIAIKNNYDVFEVREKYGAPPFWEDKLVQVNSWNNAAGFRYPLQLPQSYKDDFRGAVLYLTVDLHPTTIWISGEEIIFEKIGWVMTKTCYKFYEGPDYESYLMLSRMLNFLLEINKNVGCYFGADPPTWKRVTAPSRSSVEIQYLIEEEVDILGGGIATPEIFKVVDLSAATFYQSGANIVSVQPLKDLHWYAVFQPFEWYVWLLILFTFPLAGVSLFMLRKFSTNTNDTASLSRSMWDVTIIYCWDSIKISNPSSYVAIMLGFFMIGTMILVSEYMGSFTSFIAKPNFLQLPIDTVDQFLVSDMKWVAGRMAKYYTDYFDYMPNIKTRLIRIENEDEDINALEQLLAHPDSLVYFEKKGLVEWITCHNSVNLHGRKFHYSKDTLGYYNTFLYFKKGSRYVESFSRKILLLQDMGIINQNHIWFLIQNDLRRCHDTKPGKIELLELVHLKTAFLLLAVGYGSAFLCFLREMVAKHYKLVKND